MTQHLTVCVYLKVGWMELEHQLEVMDGILEGGKLKGIYNGDIN